MARRSRTLQDEGLTPPPLYPRPKENLLLNTLEWYKKCKMQAVYMKKKSLSRRQIRVKVLSFETATKMAEVLETLTPSSIQRKTFLAISKSAWEAIANQALRNFEVGQL